MFDPPEAARGDGAFLRPGREVCGGAAAVGVEGHAGGGGEGAEEAGEEVGHWGSHDDDEEEGEDEGCCEGLQFFDVVISFFGNF